jgi:hypothetical protein
MYIDKQYHIKNIKKCDNSKIHIRQQIYIVIISYYNSKQRTHTILLKSQIYKTPAPNCFGPHWPIISKRPVLQNSC